MDSKYLEKEYILRRDKKMSVVILIMAICIAVLLTGIIYGRMDAASQAKLQEHLSQEVLRFHVLANSDSEKDQSLKLKVRDRVLGFLEENMPETDSAADAAAWVREHIDDIEKVSCDIVTAQGMHQTVSAAVTTCWFPDKSYGDVTLPAGNYEALRIELGVAKGHNCWCVLYPSLCFLDTVNAVVPDEGKEKLKNVLTEEEYAEVTATSDFKIGWFFFGEK